MKVTFLGWLAAMSVADRTTLTPRTRSTHCCCVRLPLIANPPDRIANHRYAAFVRRTPIEPVFPKIADPTSRGGGSSDAVAAYPCRWRRFARGSTLWTAILAGPGKPARLAGPGTRSVHPAWRGTPLGWPEVVISSQVLIVPSQRRLHSSGFDRVDGRRCSASRFG